MNGPENSRIGRVLLNEKFLRVVTRGTAAGAGVSGGAVELLAAKELVDGHTGDALFDGVIGAALITIGVGMANINRISNWFAHRGH